MRLIRGLLPHCHPETLLNVCRLFSAHLLSTEKNAHACASVPCTTCCPILSSSSSGKLSKAKAVAQLSVARSVGHLSSTAVARRRFGFPGSPKLRSMERQRHCTDLLELVGHSPFALLRCRRGHAFVMFPPTTVQQAYCVYNFGQ